MKPSLCTLLRKYMSLNVSFREIGGYSPGIPRVLDRRGFRHDSSIEISISGSCEEYPRPDGPNSDLQAMYSENFGTALRVYCRKPSSRMGFLVISVFFALNQKNRMVIQRSKRILICCLGCLELLQSYGYEIGHATLLVCIWTSSEEIIFFFSRSYF